MDKIFETIIFNRKALINIIDDTSLNKLNIIPEKFNNSIIWNIAHTLVTQQLLCYKLSGLPMSLDQNFIDKFSKGSKATTNVSQEEVQFIKESLIEEVLKTKSDFENGVFKSYSPYSTSTGVTLNNIDEALLFNAFHEGIHLGVTIAIRRIV